jgi:hypothetical protein
MKDEYTIITATDDLDSIASAVKHIPHEIKKVVGGIAEVKVKLAKYDFLYLRLVLPADRVQIIDKEYVNVYGDFFST